MLFGSVCSGIEAASVAWEPLGWRAAWFAEIDKAASAVLAYRFPHIANHGDMTVLPDLVRAGLIVAPDILVGGTPCQAFSVAGRRLGLADARGQLTLSYVDLADAIDDARTAAGDEPCVVVWENVPGVLSQKDNAFGCFLAGLAGEDEPLVPAGKKWSDAGYVSGPKRAIAWRIQDAQYHRLAQRRRRVFVVASARQGFDPTEILFEFDGVRRDSPPSREAGEGATHAVAPCLTSSGRGVERPGDPRGQDPDDGVLSGPVRGAVGVAVDFQNASLGDVCGTLDAEGQKRGNRGHGVLEPLAFGGGNCSGPIAAAAAALNANERYDFDSETFVVHGTQDPCHSTTTAFALQRNSGGENVICFSSKDFGADATVNLAPCLRAGDHADSHANPQAGDTGHPLAAGAHPPAVCVTEPVTHTLKAEGFDASEDGTGRGQPITAYGTMAVRRLLPVECERLQGFPDNWTRIPVRHYRERKITATRPADMWEQDPAGGWWLMAADGPRYKQLGNSMARPCMTWLGQRIKRHLEILPYLRLLG